MNQKFVFCHGFGFSNKFWENLVQYFDDKDCIFIETNYFGAQISDITLEKKPNTEYIGIGHSLGFAKLCTSAIAFDYLIGLNAFINFLGVNTALRQTRYKEYVAFKNSFTMCPTNVLAAFNKQCGIVPDAISSTTQLNINILNHDIDLLQNSFELQKNSNILIIGAMNDAIVPPTLIEDNFQNTNVKLHFMKTGHHGLGFLHSKEIFHLIKHFIPHKKIASK